MLTGPAPWALLGVRGMTHGSSIRTNIPPMPKPYIPKTSTLATSEGCLAGAVVDAKPIAFIVYVAMDVSLASR